MKVRVMKAVDIDNDIVTHMLSEFIDWLDEKGFVRALPDDMEYNIDLVKRYIEEKVAFE